MSLLVGRKAICGYLGGVDWRTVRRWVKAKGLPVAQGNGQRPTMLTEQVDAWQRQRLGERKAS